MAEVNWRVKDDPTASDPDEAWTILLKGRPKSASSTRSTTYEGDIPPEPQPDEFPDQESYEESRGYWRSHFGRVQAMARKTSRPS